MARTGATTKITTRFTLEGRVVEAFRGPWTPRDDVFHDPAIAREFVQHLEPSYGPSVVRVRGESDLLPDGTRPHPYLSLSLQRQAIGDWLLDDLPGTVGRNRRIREEPRNWDYTTSSLRWFTGRYPLDAWEEAEDPALLLYVAGRRAKLHRQVVAAACACARRAERFLPERSVAERQALRYAELWVRNEAYDLTVADATAEAERSMAARWNRLGARNDGVSDRAAGRVRAADAFVNAAASVSRRNTARRASTAASQAALSLFLSSGVRGPELDEVRRSLTEEVRKHLPTIDYLRALVEAERS